MKIEIYTKDNCGYCVRAKSLLTTKNVPFTQYHIGKDVTRDEVIAKFPHVRTVPIVLIDDVFLGGFTDLEQLFNSNNQAAA